MNIWRSVDLRYAVANGCDHTLITVILAVMEKQLQSTTDDLMSSFQDG